MINIMQFDFFPLYDTIITIMSLSPSSLGLILISSISLIFLPLVLFSVSEKIVKGFFTGIGIGIGKAAVDKVLESTTGSGDSTKGSNAGSSNTGSSNSGSSNSGSSNSGSGDSGAGGNGSSGGSGS